MQLFYFPFLKFFIKKVKLSRRAQRARARPKTGAETQEGEQEQQQRQQISRGTRSIHFGVFLLFILYRIGGLVASSWLVCFEKVCVKWYTYTVFAISVLHLCNTVGY